MTEAWQQLFELVKNLNLFLSKKGNNSINSNAFRGQEMSIDQASCSMHYRAAGRTTNRKKPLAVHFDATQLQLPEVARPRYLSSTRLVLPSKGKRTYTLTLTKLARTKKHNMSSRQ
ncbi:hypothetical protein AWZ03_012403 [Drosophila navojoa]|uniref:Uncharacterized protein n=1 Tax=Drosophila navojoa TaxID=7232 RepID=A0A484AXG0_DRONA|nr:uncharacterized protein LOC108656322 [Drosophila navojoa]TDG41176.1 hypothetical protein AWZ03_012403 [Drosophila navojoa]